MNNIKKTSPGRRAGSRPSRTSIRTILGAAVGCALIGASAPVRADRITGTRYFRPETDLIALHYDHAGDRDDGHSAAADLTMLVSLYGRAWVQERAVPVSGAFGLNKKLFVPESDVVMDAVWGRGGWIAAARDWNAAVRAAEARWRAILQQGGNVYVKEGGQSDFTAAVVRRLQQTMPGVYLRNRIYVVQHSIWNEQQTTPEALAFVKENTKYSRIRDGNRFLNVEGGDREFERLAVSHPLFGEAWRAAFAYYPPSIRLDFSDTAELMHILKLGEIGIQEFAQRFLAPGAVTPPPPPSGTGGNGTVESPPPSDTSDTRTRRSTRSGSGR